MKRGSPGVLAALWLSLLLAGLLLSVTQGVVAMSVEDMAAALLRGLRGQAAGEAELSLVRIVWQLRVPRALLACLVGAALGAAGAAMQGLFRNPLSDPYLLGTASGASLGATVALGAGGSGVVGVAFVGSGATLRASVAGASFVGALGAVGLTLLAAGAQGRRRGTTLLLAGVAVGSLLTAVSSYLLLREGDQLRRWMAWTLGSLSWASWQDVRWLAPQLFVGLGALIALGRALDAMSLGEDTARTLAPSLQLQRLGTLAAASLLTAAAVSTAGVIGFVGLVAPHLQRRLGVVQHRQLIPAAALLGACLLLYADMGARLLAQPRELPVGVVMTALGAPFFLALLRRTS